MTVLAVFLAVLGVIAALVCAVMLLPLSVTIRYGQALEVFAGVSFFRIKLFPQKEKKKAKEKKHRPKKQTAAENTGEKSADNGKKADGDGGQKKKHRKKELSDTLKLVLELIKSFFEVMGKHASIRIDELRVVVSRPDAADTAVQFGLCGGIVSNILAFTSNFGKAVINDKNVAVEPDFVTGKSSIGVDITISVMTGFLLSGLIKGYLKGISGK